MVCMIICIYTHNYIVIWYYCVVYYLLSLYIAIVVGWSVFFCADLIFPSHEKIPKPPGGLARSLARGGPGQGRGQLEELQVPRLPRFANPDELDEQRFYVWKSDVRLDLVDGMFMSSWKSCCWLLMFGHSLRMFAWRIWCRLKTKRQLFDAAFFPSYLVLLLMDEILHQLIGSSSHYLQGFIHPRCCLGFLPPTVPSCICVPKRTAVRQLWFPKAVRFRPDCDAWLSGTTLAYPPHLLSH